MYIVALGEAVYYRNKPNDKQLSTSMRKSSWTRCQVSNIYLQNTIQYQSIIIKISWKHLCRSSRSMNHLYWQNVEWEKIFDVGKRMASEGMELNEQLYSGEFSLLDGENVSWIVEAQEIRYYKYIAFSNSAYICNFILNLRIAKIFFWYI